MNFEYDSSRAPQAAPPRQTPPRLDRAILAADAVGYSRLMGQDEEATLRRLHEYRRLFTETVTGHGGTVFGVAGDSEMAVFDDACEAVRCALRLQEAIGTRNAVLPKESRMPIRVGVNFGPVILDGDDVYGDDVNIAARLEGFAEAGEVCVSESVFELIKGKLDCGFDSFGMQTLKNISRPVRTYRLRTDPQAIGQVVSAKRRRPRPGRRWRLAAAVFLVALLGATTWGLRVQTEKQQAEAAAERLVIETQQSVNEAQDKIQNLLEQLQQVSNKASNDDERVAVLLALLRQAQNAAADHQHLSRRRAAEIEHLVKLLESSEDRAAAERARADGLLAVLQEMQRSNGGWASTEVKLITRESVDVTGRNQARGDGLPGFRQGTGRQDQEVEPWAEAQRVTATGAEAMALTEQKATGNEAAGRDKTDAQVFDARGRTEILLATLQEAHKFVVDKRKQALGLRARLRKAQRGVANDTAAGQRLQEEIARVEGLLSTLDSLEARISDEVANVERTLQSMATAGTSQGPYAEQPLPKRKPAAPDSGATGALSLRTDKSRSPPPASNQPRQGPPLPAEAPIVAVEDSAEPPKASTHEGGASKASEPDAVSPRVESHPAAEDRADIESAAIAAQAAQKVASTTEGHWRGIGSDGAGPGVYCPTRLILEFDVSEGTLTGMDRAPPQTGANAVSGSVDQAGKFTIAAGNNWYGLTKAEGHLDAPTGRGTGRWFGRDCTGTLTLTKVE